MLFSRLRLKNRHNEGHRELRKGLARQGGFEPSTCGLEVRCSIQLSYWRTSYLVEINFQKKNKDISLAHTVYVYGIFLPLYVKGIIRAAKPLRDIIP